MPILKTEILGSIVEINYEEKERERLLSIIKKFNKRLSEFKNHEGKVSDKKIIYLAALKIENELEESDKNSLTIKNHHSIAKENIRLNDKINELNTELDHLNKINLKAIDEIDKLELKLTSLLAEIIKAKENEH